MCNGALEITSQSLGSEASTYAIVSTCHELILHYINHKIMIRFPCTTLSYTCKRSCLFSLPLNASQLLEPNLSGQPPLPGLSECIICAPHKVTTSATVVVEGGE